MKKSEDRSQEEQNEENQRKTSKLIAYLSIKNENCKMKHAMLCQIVKQAY